MSFSVGRHRKQNNNNSKNTKKKKKEITRIFLNNVTALKHLCTNIRSRFGPLCSSFMVGYLS